MMKCKEKMTEWLKLEHICVSFAAINLVLKTVLVLVGIASSDCTIVSLASLGPYHESVLVKDYVYNSKFIIIMRGVLVTDSTFSIFYSVVLILGVRKGVVSLLKSCVIYGAVILLLSSGASIPRFIEMFLVGDYNYFQRRLQAFILTVLCAIQVLVVYKTYKKFQKMQGEKHLIRKQSDQEIKEADKSAV